MHSHKLLNLSEDIQSFAQSDNIYMRIECERQSSKPVRYLTITIIFIYLFELILLPSFYYYLLSHSLLLIDDNYFPILFDFLYMPLAALTFIKSCKCKMLGFIPIIFMWNQVHILTKGFVKFILIFVIILSYIVVICHVIHFIFNLFLFFIQVNSILLRLYPLLYRLDKT